MDLAAVRAAVGQPLVFRNHGRGLGDFHLLEHFGFVPRRDQRAAAVRTAVERVGLEMIDRLGREGRPHMLLVSRLSALLSLLPAFGPRLLRFDDVARRRLGGGRGVFPRRPVPLSAGQLVHAAGRSPPPTSPCIPLPGAVWSRYRLDNVCGHIRPGVGYRRRVASFWETASTGGWRMVFQWASSTEFMGEVWLGKVAKRVI